jgi:hypothetical protein
VTLGRRDDAQLRLRFPDSLRELIKDAAETNGRSMNSEIIMRLEASFGPQSPLVNVPPLDAGVSLVINKYVEGELAARLRAIAANITGGTK